MRTVRILDTAPVAVTAAGATEEYPAGSLDGYAGTCTCGHRTETRCCQTCASNDIQRHAETNHGASFRWAV